MQPLIRTLLQQTDQEFWQSTNYKPGRRLDYRNRDDAAMVPVWLVIETGVVKRFLDELRAYAAVDPAAVQLVSDYQRQIHQRLDADPTIRHRAMVAMRRLGSARPGSV